MEELTPSHKAFWKITKALKTEGCIPIPPVPPLKKPDNSVAPDDAEIAECLSNPNALTLPLRTTLLIFYILRKRSRINPPSNPKMICLPPRSAKSKHCFPPVWKEAEVIGIHKPGKPRDLPASYRPINLLSGLATGILPLDTSVLTRLDDVSEKEFFKAPPSLPYCTPRRLTIFRVHHQASNSRYSRMIQQFTFVLGSKNLHSSASREPLIS
ncbi:Probable RNA-directed DNA polymerase from transposon BS [Eumeta japonica]|uniref:Probable RNA-directed DNA polymerase from transposon BS n=1 Tax=Eumeta variegata TaxID=151549 RepID=A0A4C1W6C8_EUMVA|nr:Probable RNA-directed DNA polymerase from transposon BS [Eumeta japonica]